MAEVEQQSDYAQLESTSAGSIKSVHQSLTPAYQS